MSGHFPDVIFRSVDPNNIFPTNVTILSNSYLPFTMRISGIAFNANIDWSNTVTLKDVNIYQVGQSGEFIQLSDDQFTIYSSNQNPLFENFENRMTPVPEPATMLLLGSEFLGLAGYGRKKFFKK